MRHTAFKAAFLYLLAGLAWVILTNSLVAHCIVAFPAIQPAVITYMLHALFVLLSTLAIYYLLRKTPPVSNSDTWQYRELFFNHAVPMWVYDVETLRFMAVNDAAVAKYGYSQAEFLNMTILQIRDESEVPKVLEDMQRTVHTKSYRGLWQHRKKNGEYFTTEIYSSLTHYHGREARMIMAIDIDSEIRASLKTKDFGTRYELLAKVTPDAVYYWDMQSGTLTWNHGPSSLFGYLEEDITPDINWWDDKLHPDDKVRVTKTLRNAIRFGNVQWSERYRFRCANGTYKYVHDRGSILYNNKQKAQRMVGVMQDIDKEVQQRQQIELLSLVASQTTNAVFITNARGEMEWANDAFCYHTGYTLKEVIGKRPRDFIAGAGSNKDTITTIDLKMREGVAFSEEIINYKKNGTPYWVQMSVTPILDDEGKVEKFISIQTDITEKKNFTNLLQEQNNTLREIAWMNSHELRRPVSSILAITSLIEKDSTDQATNLRLILMLQKSVTELDEMIHRMQSKLKQQEDDLR